MKKVYNLVLAFVLFSSLANAQSQLGEIRGKVIDAKTKKPMDYVSVSIVLNGQQKATAITDDDGNYIVKTLPPGEYEIRITSLGFRNQTITGVDVVSDQITFQNIGMEVNPTGETLPDIVIERKPPIIKQDGQGTTVTAKTIARSPTKNINAIANTVRGVDARAGGTPSFRGARPEGTAYYIDGIRIQGNIGVPFGAIDQVEVITGGTAAQYGDFIGGAISLSTKTPTTQFKRYFEYRTSSPFYGYLDNSHYNDLQGQISGPIKVINKGKEKKERVLVGFTITGNAVYSREPSPRATDMYKVKDDVLRRIEAQPLTRNPTGGFVNSAEYLTKNDLEKVPYRLNAANQSFNLSGNFIYQPTATISVRLGYQANYSRGRSSSYSQSLMNYSNNPLGTSFTLRPYVQFTQMFAKKSEEDAKKAFVANAFYTVRLSYERTFSQTENADFGEDVFSYGYIGKFKTYSRPIYTRVNKSFGQTGDPADKYAYFNTKTNKWDTLYLTSYWKQEYVQQDTLTTFEQADINRVKGNYTQNIYDFYRANNFRIRSISDITQEGGLINGREPSGIYSNMWANAGTSQSGFSKSMNETYAMYVMSEASVGSNPKARHDLQFGFSYEQQIQRGYGLGAVGLWTLMRQLVNSQFSGNDSSKVIVTFNANGAFEDTVKFHPKIVDENQKTFDRNLRAHLLKIGAKDVYGRPYGDGTNGTVNIQEAKIDVNMYDPGTYSLDMFSADDLLNNGNSLVSYYGYDYLGNQVNGKQSIDKFLLDPQNRTLGAFQPIYMAAWVQDKFVFKDLIVRLGLRMERYDANQLVLKDPYSMFPIHTVGDVKRGNLLNLKSAIPGSMGDGYKVYIDNEQQEAGKTHISGFRNGNDWFDANGNPVTDPTALYKNSRADGAEISKNTPFLVKQGQKVLDATSFTPYVPEVKILPRVTFSFPISTTANFFGTYDILAQRPQGNIAQIDDYYYLSNRLTGIIANPDLKMTQVTDYEIGFSQQVGDNAGLKLIASYREFRNLLQQYRYVQAWPFDYTTYGNVDFMTVKSLGAEYVLREVGNVTLQASYNMQFADGTGSNANSAGTLVSSGNAQQRDLFPVDYDTRHIVKGTFDYHYRSGKDYNGPIVSGKKILENAGFSIIFNSSSGRPYTQIKEPITTTQSGVVQRSQVLGTINGANLPSQFFTDLNVDKVFSLQSKTLEGKTNNYQLRLYLEVQNLFNAANVLSVYQYTGSAYDDGYINSPQADAQKRNATNTQSFVDLYNIRVVNPGAFAFPRLTRFGVSLVF